MFYIIAKEKKTGIQERMVLPGISRNSTGYEYGLALAETIRQYMIDGTGAMVEVFDDSDLLIHCLMVVPKGGSVMVTENGAGTKPLSITFPVNQNKLPDKYLVMVNAEHNNNKFYRLSDLGNGQCGAYYGRIGLKQDESRFATHVSKPHIYPDYMYGIKLAEKLSKGYKDKTECHIVADSSNNQFRPIINPRVAALVQRLMRFANQTIKENYTVTSQSVTEVMIQQARQEISALRKATNLQEFNQHLLELMHTIPRRIDGNKEQGVKAMMASKISDFGRIIVREENILDVMEGQVCVNVQKAKDSITMLQAMGLEIYEARPEQIKQVLSHLNDELKPKLVATYRVINKKAQQRFDKYLEENRNGRQRVKVKQFWHGSGNGNWFSILQKNLLLDPDAPVTGKMFGHGICVKRSAITSM